MELENLKVKVVDIKPNDILIINIDKLHAFHILYVAFY